MKTITIETTKLNVPEKYADPKILIAEIEKSKSKWAAFQDEGGIWYTVTVVNGALHAEPEKLVKSIQAEKIEQAAKRLVRNDENSGRQYSDDDGNSPYGA